MVPVEIYLGTYIHCASDQATRFAFAPNSRSIDHLHEGSGTTYVSPHKFSRLGNAFNQPHAFPMEPKISVLLTGYTYTPSEVWMSDDTEAWSII